MSDLLPEATVKFCVRKRIFYFVTTHKIQKTMTVDYVSGLPPAISKTLSQGLNFLKQATPDDKVATTAGVGAPQVAPNGSPIDGSVAVTKGAPVEAQLEIVIDTSAFAETDVVQAIIGDASQVHEGTCYDCGAGNTNQATIYIGSPSCNAYDVFKGRLCSTPYTFAALELTVEKTAGATGNLALPENFRMSRVNLTGDGDVAVQPIRIYEDKTTTFPRADMKIANIPLLNKINLFDRDTRWVFNNLSGKRLYRLVLFTGVRKEN